MYDLAIALLLIIMWFSCYLFAFVCGYFAYSEFGTHNTGAAIVWIIAAIAFLPNTWRFMYFKDEES